MFTLEILDTILVFLSHPSDERRYFGHINRNLYENTLFKRSLNKLMIEKSIEKLIAEKYISEIKVIEHNSLLNQDLEVTYYEITWEGHFFISQGGYTGRRRREVSEKERIESLENGRALTESQMLDGQRHLNKLTFWVALASCIAGIYYLIQIYSFLFCSGGQQD